MPWFIMKVLRVPCLAFGLFECVCVWQGGRYVQPAKEVYISIVLF
jgi:hypothetical protein